MKAHQSLDRNSEALLGIRKILLDLCNYTRAYCMARLTDVIHYSYIDLFQVWVLDENQFSNFGDTFPIVLSEVGKQKAEEAFMVRELS